MNKTERKELKDIELGFLAGVSDSKQAVKLGLSKQGFYQRYWSLRKRQLLSDREANMAE